MEEMCRDHALRLWEEIPPDGELPCRATEERNQVWEPYSGPRMWEKNIWNVAAERRTEYNSLSLQSAGPNEIHLAVVSTLLNNLLREPVSRDWPLVCLELLAQCPEVEDRQETAELAARETPEGVAML